MPQLFSSAAMPSTHRSAPFVWLVPLLLVGFAPQASAQLDLPKSRERKVITTPPPAETKPVTTGPVTTEPGGDGAAPQGGETPVTGPPTGTGTASQEPGASSTSINVDPSRLPAGTASNRRIIGATPGVLGFDPATGRNPARGQEGGLDLPSRPRPSPAAGAAPITAPDVRPARGRADAPDEVPSRAQSPASLDGLRPAVRLVYTTVAGIKKTHDRVVEDGAQRLAESGEDGLIAARVALDEEHAPLFLCGVMALLRGGTPEDHDLVVAALKRRMPARAAGGAVDALVRLDPVRAKPELLVQLLRHPQTPARSSAMSALMRVREAGLVPLLVPALEDDLSDVRSRAVELIARIDSPDTLRLLLDRLDDRSPTVARKASEALARLADDRTDGALREIAFQDPLPMRRQAAAWIAIADREDAALRAILGPADVPFLRRALDARQPYVAGAAAVALAGIGFRSADVASTTWLDREVPEHLVKLAAGYEFFSDYETVRPAVLRRLHQITGVNYGSDGIEWTKWWLNERDRFRGSRAVLELRPEDEGRLIVRVTPGDERGSFTLLGAGLVAEPASALRISGEEIWLDAAQSRALVDLVREEGLLGFERLPGSRGILGAEGRSLELALGSASKTFRFGLLQTTPWFERTVELASTIRTLNRWQRFPHPTEHIDRRGLFLAERPWWEVERTRGERSARREALLYSYLAAVDPDQRGDALLELESLAQTEGTADQTDFPRLMRLLEGETIYNARARRIVALARLAAGAEARAQDGALLAPFADGAAAQLTAVLHDRFGPYAAEDLGELLAVRGREAVRAAATGERGLLRAIAATALGRGTDESDVTVLRGLLTDPDPDVQVAAVQALGQARAEEARDEILLRAAFDDYDPAVRQAALRALGSYGGRGAQDLLVRALTGQDARLKVAAADGLATLRDPATVPYLMAIFRAGRRSAAFDAARAGLMALGEAAHDELFAALRAPSQELRREASIALAQQGVPDAAPSLIRAMTEDSEDGLIGFELAVLSCVDYRAASDPTEEWYRWWDMVDRKAPLSWFRAACEAAGLRVPPDDAFAEGGTSELREFLLALMASSEFDWLVERARRELGRLLGEDLGELPQARAEREAWFAKLGERIQLPAATVAPAPPPTPAPAGG